MEGGASVDGRRLISVVIPTYNRADLLPACIDSALSQEYSPFEVIVVDDGSSDNTAEVCRAYGERIRYVKKPNGGTASALNVGLREMRGSWFKWLSSDDMLPKGALESLASAGSKTNAGVVYGDLIEVGLSGKVRTERHQRAVASEQDFMVELWRHFVGSAAGSMIRSSAFVRVGPFDETIGYAEDYEWWLRAALVHRIRFQHVAAFTGMYRVHPGQISQERRAAAGRKQDLIRRKVASQLAEAAQRDQQLADYMARTTSRLQRIYRPLAPLARMLTPVPGSTTAAYFLARLFPRISSEIYWAESPPLPRQRLKSP